MGFDYIFLGVGARPPGGRCKSLTPDKRTLAVSLYEEKKLPVMKIYEMMEISKPTLYSYFREAQEASK